MGKSTSTPSDTTPPQTPSLISPADNSVVTSLPITFDWTDVSDDKTPPVKYELQVDDNNDFSSPIVNQIELTSSNYSVSLGNGVYYWRVRAKDNANNYSGWSNTWTITVNVTTPTEDVIKVKPNFVIKTAGTGNRVNLEYSVSTAGTVHIKIYSLDGRLVREIVKYSNEGLHEETWDMWDNTGSDVQSGVYLLYYITPQGASIVETVIQEQHPTKNVLKS